MCFALLCCLDFPDVYYFLWRYLIYIDEKIGEEEEGSTCVL